MLSSSLIHAQCINNLTPNSSILDEGDQSQLAAWLPAGFEYEANLIHDSEVSGSSATTVHNSVDGHSNTIVVGISEDGYIFGGYNEGAWSSNTELLTNLDNNFLFSLTLQEKYNAIPGEVHIWNRGGVGLSFGEGTPVGSSVIAGDLAFASSSSSGVICINDLGGGYECPAVLEADCELWMNGGNGWSGFTDRFRFVRWEVWQLNTSGNPLVNGADSDGDGVCDLSEISGCQDDTACNYNAAATDADTCNYPSASCATCSGETDGTGTVIINDTDGDGVCNADEIEGCQNEMACNYNPLATDAGECILPDGCTDINAVNYCDHYICDDGTCEYVGCTNPLAFNYNANADYDDGSCIEVPGCTDVNACNYESFASTDNGSCLFITTADAGSTQLGCVSFVLNANTPVHGTGEWSTSSPLAVFEDVHDPNTTVSGLESGFNFLTWTITNGVCSSSDSVTIGVTDGGCTDPTALNYDDTISCDDGSCDYGPTEGCGDITACNYDSEIPSDVTNTCIYPDGCTDMAAVNYNSLAQCDNGICEYAGCTNPNASNYSPQADYDDGSCADILGCTNYLACNYNSVATLENNTCIYPVGCQTCSGETDGTGTTVSTDADNDGVCDADEVLGCTDITACNYTEAATEEDGSCEYANDLADAGPDLENCQQFGQFALFSPQGVIPDGYTGLWTVESGTASITIATGNNPSPQVRLNPGQSSVLRLTISSIDGSGCTSYDEMTVTNYEYVGYPDAGEDQEQCQNGSFTLDATPAPVGEGVWTWDNPNIIVANDIQHDSPVINLPEGESVTLTWTVTNGTCENSDTVTLTNYAAATVAEAEDDFSFCGSFLFPLVGNQPTVGTPQWSKVDGPGSFNGSGTNVTGVLHDGLTTTYRYTISNGVCSTYDEITVTNDQNVTANAGIDQIDACGNIYLSAEIPAIGAGEWTGDHPNLSFSDVNGPNSELFGLAPGESTTLTWTVTNGACSASNDVFISRGIEGCTHFLASNYNPDADCDDDSCVYASGCTNTIACNYDPIAVLDDESCILPDGCTDEEALNFLSSALCDDGSCEYPTPEGCGVAGACNYDPEVSPEFSENCIYPDGCTDEGALNFTALASCDDGSCIYAGCMEEGDVNYDPQAVFDDGSCELYLSSCPGDFDGNGSISAFDLSAFLGIFGTVCD